MSARSRSDFLKPRWSKVFSDLWGDKTRTTLVVASIAVGVFAVGMIITAYVILLEDINVSYASANPVNIEIWTDPFHEDFIRVIEKVPGVDDVEGRYIIRIRGRKSDENWQRMSLVGLDDFQRSTINRLDVIDGTGIPGRYEALISQDFINNTGFQVGDEIEIELPAGSTQNLTVVGLVTDQTQAGPDPETTSNAYVTEDTVSAFGLGRSFNRLLVTVDGDGSDAAFIADIAAQVEDKVESHGREVYRMEEGLSSEHPMIDTTLAIIGVLGALGVLVTILSASLIINTLNALLTQQLRQIGVMKLIGGRSFQILGMYLTLVMAYSVIALVLAVPLGVVAGNALASYMTFLLRAVLQGYRVVPAAVVTQVLIAFLIPLGAGFFPVNRGARTSVRRAISNYRPDHQAARRSILSRGARWLRWVSRPILLSIRNTFRQKGRLALTIFTLTIAGAVFIAVFNVRASMDHVMDQVMQHFLGDITVSFSQPYKINRVDRSLLGVPGITGVEGWGGASGEIWDEKDELVTGLTIVAPPQDTDLLEPDFIAGRWLLPDEKKAMVVSESIYDYYPDLQPGDTVIVKIPGNREEAWEVVGIYRFINMFGDPMAYANFEYVSNKINMANQAASFRITTEAQGADSLRELIGRIDRQLADRGFSIRSIEAGDLLRENASIGINTLVIFLLIMAILTAFVGSIGLTGTMSINVLERTREIGVMRTIGAVDFVIMQSVIVEALIIGLMTWVLAIGFSFPISEGLLRIIGQAMSGSALDLVFTPIGMILWLGVVAVLSIVASIMPARNAARLTINEVLAYE